MRITFLGHVGLYVETKGGSVLCDPWFNPAYFASWFPFPRNDDLDVERFSHPDYLYVTHLHHDHFDPAFLAEHVDKRARVLLPDFRAPFLERELRALGFDDIVATKHGHTVDLGDLQATIFTFNEPADGPLGDSLIVLADGTATILDQNDARPGNVDELLALGPFDAQFVQFSGAIWYPIAYDFPPELRAELSREKRANQMDRALHYVQWIAARNVFPCAGPPAFLDDDLFEVNDFDNSPDNIFPDQLAFLDELGARGIDTGKLVVPGTEIDLVDGTCVVTHPSPDSTARPFRDKRAYLERYRADMRPRLAAERASWSDTGIDLLAALREWFEPLLARAPITSAGIAGNVVLDLSAPGGGRESIVIDFVESEVRAGGGDEPAVYRVAVDRRLVETLVIRREPDWVNSLFLSCRFVAHRDGPFNEYVMTFFKALSPERIDLVEAAHAARRHADDWTELAGWRVERYCPHRGADLERFGSVEGGVLTCALHHWQFDLETGRCLTSDDRTLRCERLPDAPG